jgi:hypothetical protein
MPVANRSSCCPFAVPLSPPYLPERCLHNPLSLRAYRVGIVGLCPFLSQQQDSVISHVQQDAGKETPGLLEQQAVDGADTENRRPRKQGMVHGKKGCGSEHRAPAAPIAVKGAIEQPAKQVLLSEWGEAHGRDSVSNAQARELGSRLLSVAQQLGERRNVTQKSGVAMSQKFIRQTGLVLSELLLKSANPV